MSDVCRLNFGALFDIKDEGARRRIAELEAKVTVLEARRQIFVGTEREIAALQESGAIRVGDIAITTDEEPGEGTGGGNTGGTETGSETQEGDGEV